MRLSLSAEKRDALYEQVLVHLTGIEDLRRAIKSQDFETAGRLGREFVDEVGLILDALGWGDEAGGPTEFDVDPVLLRRVLPEIRDRARGQRTFEEGYQEEVRVPYERAGLAAEACDELLAAIEASTDAPRR